MARETKKTSFLWFALGGGVGLCVIAAVGFITFKKNPATHFEPNDATTSEVERPQYREVEPPIEEPAKSVSRPEHRLEDSQRSKVAEKPERMEIETLTIKAIDEPAAQNKGSAKSARTEIPARKPKERATERKASKPIQAKNKKVIANRESAPRDTLKEISTARSSLTLDDTAELLEEKIKDRFPLPEVAQDQAPSEDIFAKTKPTRAPPTKRARIAIPESDPELEKLFQRSEKEPKSNPTMAAPQPAAPKVAAIQRPLTPEEELAQPFGAPTSTAIAGKNRLRISLSDISVSNGVNKGSAMQYLANHTEKMKTCFTEEGTSNLQTVEVKVSTSRLGMIEAVVVTSNVAGREELSSCLRAKLGKGSKSLFSTKSSIVAGTGGGQIDFDLILRKN